LCWEERCGDGVGIDCGDGFEKVWVCVEGGGGVEDERGVFEKAGWVSGWGEEARVNWLWEARYQNLIENRRVRSNEWKYEHLEIRLEYSGTNVVKPGTHDIGHKHIRW